MTLNCDDWKSLVGKRLRVEHNDNVYEGIMQGVEDSYIYTAGPITTANPWILKLDDGRLIHFAHSWNLREVHEERFRD